MLRWVNGRGPRQYGMDFVVWTQHNVVELIEHKLGIDLGVTGMGKLLAKLGLTRQKPLQRVCQRDLEAIEAWRRRQFLEISKRAKSRGGEAFFWDESGFGADAVPGKIWGVKGQTPIIDRPGQRQSIRAVSAVTARGGFWCCAYEDGLNADLIVALLRRMMRHRTRPVYQVLDKLPAHQTVLVKAYVASTNGMLTLRFLPGYAPDLSPDELAWSHMKRPSVARTSSLRGEKLQEKIEAQVTAVKRKPRLAQSYFKAPTVVHITDF